MTKEQEMREEFGNLMKSNKKLGSIYKKIENGTATYEDANLFAGEVGKALSKVFNNTVANFDDDTLKVIKGMLFQNNDIVSIVCESVQANLNSVAGVGINPIKPSAGRQTGRIDGIIEAIKDSEFDSALLDLRRNTETVALSLVDEYVQANANFQAKAGLKPVIVRKWDGITGTHDTRRTDWCRDLEGTFDYGSEPKNIYRRHKGCGCVVSYFPNKKVNGIMASLAKGQKDISNSLRKTEFSEDIQRILKAEWN